MTQDFEASKGVVVAPRSGEGNMGARGHDEYQISFPLRGRRYVV